LRFTKYETSGALHWGKLGGRGVNPTARRLYGPGLSLPAEQRRELELRFFGSIRLRNGTFKTTYARRLDDVNALIQQLLPPERPLIVMDVAASSGISTLEWAESLRLVGVQHRMIAGDSSVNAFLVDAGAGLRVLVDATGYPLQFDVFGRAVTNPPRRRDRVALFPLLLFLRRAAARARRDASATGTPLALVSPTLLDAADVEVVDDDILEAAAPFERVHILRAANILNRGYFDDATLTRMARNLRERILPGGLLVVVRTEKDGRNDGTVFRREDSGRFVALARIGKGSEVEELVAAL
jgi:hypothetical protein